jgi:transposase
MFERNLEYCEQFMINASNIPVYIAINPVDMRKSINGLSSLVAGELDMDPLLDGIFVFSNRHRKIIKVLYWHHNGFCLLQKRLEKEKFKWPADREQLLEVDFRQLSWLLEGLDITKIQPHSKLNYTHAY